MGCNGLPFVEVNQDIYCNVSERWTTRISEVGAILTIIIPTTYAVLALLAMVFWRRKKFGVRQIKRVYEENMLLVYFKENFGEELYKLIKEGPPKGHPHYTVFNRDEAYVYMLERRRDGIFIRGSSEVWIRENKDNREFCRVWVSGKMLKELPDIQSYIPPTWLKIPTVANLAVVVVTLICTPILKVVWDILDVAADCYYFAQLERGFFIDSNITRNTNVNNAILVFAVFGALKSTAMGYGYCNLVLNNTGHYASVSTFIRSCLVCLKIFSEDAPELILEYFFVDRYVTQNQPWVLIFKDFITAVLYALPIIRFLTEGTKNFPLYRVVEREGEYISLHLLKMENKGGSWVKVYIACVLAHVAFSIVTMVRVMGMVHQCPVH